jgi:hypothetical protein
MNILKQSTAVTIKLGPFVDSTDGVTPETGLTISQADIRLSKNGGAFAQTNNATGATHDENGWYGIPLNTTDTATLGMLQIAVYESGALPCFTQYTVVPANVYDSLVAGTDILDASMAQILGTAISTPATAGVLDINVKNIANAIVNTATAQIGTNVVSQANIDFGALQKTSLNAATPASVVGAVGSVTGAVGSVTAGVTIADGAITAAKIADAAIDIATFAADCKTGTYLNAQVKGQDNIDFGALQKTSLNAATPASVQNIPATGTGFTAIPWNASWDAEIQSECNDALTAYDPPTRTEATADKDAIIVYVDKIDDATNGLTAIKAEVEGLAGAAMRGTDNAALASVCTETRLAELDAANLITDVANVKTDTTAILVDTADIQPKIGTPAASVSADIAAVKVDSAAIKLQTDALPSGIAKNVALSNFQFFIVLSSDHVSAASGKTITGTISKDGGTFAALTNAISEIGNGMYKVNLTQTEMNADVVTLKFTETNCDQRMITVYTT